MNLLFLAGTCVKPVEAFTNIHDESSVPALCRQHSRHYIQNPYQYLSGLEKETTILEKYHIDQAFYFLIKFEKCTECRKMVKNIHLECHKCLNSSSSNFDCCLKCKRISQIRYVVKVFKAIFLKFIHKKNSPGVINYFLENFPRRITQESIFSILSEVSFDYKSLNILFNIFTSESTNQTQTIKSELDKIEKCLKYYVKVKHRETTDLFYDFIFNSCEIEEPELIFYSYKFNLEFLLTLKTLELSRLLYSIAMFNPTKMIDEKITSEVLEKILFQTNSLNLTLETELFYCLCLDLVRMKCCKRLQIFFFKFKEYQNILSEKQILKIIQTIINDNCEEVTFDWVAKAMWNDSLNSISDTEDDTDILSNEHSIKLNDNSEKNVLYGSSPETENLNDFFHNKNIAQSCSYCNDNQNDIVHNQLHLVNNSVRKNLLGRESFSTSFYSTCKHYKSKCDILKHLISFNKKNIKQTGYLKIIEMIFSQSKNKEKFEILINEFYGYIYHAKLGDDHWNYIFSLHSQHNTSYSLNQELANKLICSLIVINDSTQLEKFFNQIIKSQFIGEISSPTSNIASPITIIEYAIDQLIKNNKSVIDALMLQNLLFSFDPITVIKKYLNFSVTGVETIITYFDIQNFESLAEKEIDLLFNYCLNNSKYEILLRFGDVLSYEQANQLNTDNFRNLFSSLLTQTNITEGQSFLMKYFDTPFMYRFLQYFLKYFSINEFYCDLIFQNLIKNQLFQQYFYDGFEDTKCHRILNNFYMREIVQELSNDLANKFSLLKCFIKYLNLEQQNVVKALLIYNMLCELYSIEDNKEQKDLICLIQYQLNLFPSNEERIEFIFKNFNPVNFKSANDNHHELFENMIQNIDINILLKYLEAKQNE